MNNIKLTRRKFLKSATVSAAGLACGGSISSKLYAASDNYNGPLWLTVNADGGLDSTQLFDPKGYAGPFDSKNPERINNYDQAAIAQIGNIRYAPPPDKFQAGGVLYDESLYTLKQFVSTYFQRLLVINGIDSRTNSHADGQLFNLAGRLRKDFPCFSALVAAANSPNKSLSFITYGGYSASADLLTPVRMNNSALNALFEIAYPNRSHSPKLANGRQYLPDNLLQLIRNTSQTRHEAMLAQQALPRIQNALKKLINARSTTSNLQGFVDNLLMVPAKPLSAFNSRKNAHRLYLQGRIALSAYQQGLTVSANLSMSGFDTHSKHDLVHYPRLMDLLQGIDGILQEAAARGLSDRLIVVVTSDFGRNPGYNAQDGKDHWPIGSTFIIGNNTNLVRGNQVIGATNDNLEAIAVDPFSLMPDFNGSNPAAISITPAEIHRALRGLAGISSNPLVQTYPLEGSELAIFT